MKELHPNEGLRIFDIKWQVTTAGPSPNENKRIEVFLLGCDKAMQGNPCNGCFNSLTWDKSIAEFSRDPIEVADMINEGCDPNNKYITIGGGEPSDQLEYLIPFVKRLKEHNFHIIMYTWRSLKEILNPILRSLEVTIRTRKFKELIKYIDIIIDGEFKQEELLWDINDSNTARNFVGSGNQIIWDLSSLSCYYGYALRDIKNITLIRKDKDNKKNILYFDTYVNSKMLTLNRRHKKYD